MREKGIEKKLIFRNPHLRMRRENFGGIVKVDNNVLLLGKKEFEVLEDFHHMSKKEAVQKYGSVVEQLRRHKLLLVIGLQKARKILEERR